MKADEVLRLYTAGNRNFRRVSLRGQSFKGKKLSGADFTEADIRGANFTNANLKGTNFSGAQAGLQLGGVTALVLVSLLLSALSGFIASWAGIFVGNNLLDSDPSYILARRLTIATVFAVFFFVTIGKKDLGAGLRTVVVAGVLAAVLPTALAVALTVTGIENEALAGALTGAGPLGGMLACAGAVVGTLGGALAVAVAGAVAVACAGAMVGTVAVAAALVVAVPGTMAGTVIVPLAGAWAGATTLLGGYIAQCAVAGDEQFAWVWKLAVTFAALWGTSFRNANLTDANFTEATLHNTNLNNAILKRTCLFRAHKVYWAKVNGTILINSAVQDLVVTRNGQNKSFVGLNLKGANLTEADLSYANFTEADLSGATLQGACLEWTNLTKTQAIETNFNQAKLTGACLEAWNIDSTTQLNGATCDYVYLLNNQRERCPSSGEFAPGEFAKLFQEVLDTVDLIFRNGIDWKAFAYSFKKLQVENEDIELSIRSIENKGDGVFVVKVIVPADVNKAKIHSDLTQDYQFALKALEARYQAELRSKDEQMTIDRQHQAELQEVIKLLANKPDNDREGKLVIIKVGKGDLRQGFPVTLQIGAENTLPFAEITGDLSPAPDILEQYNQWRSAYRKSLLACLRIKVPASQVTNFSTTEFIEECNQSAESLRNSLNVWLNSESFRPVKERLLEKLNPSESIRVILQTENLQLRRLPWNLWEFFDRYPKAEFALSFPVYERVEKLSSPSALVRILAILGHDTEIDIQKDRDIIMQLPDAEVKFIKQPQRKELDDKLWSQPWDILFFAGHSSSLTDDQDGQININETDSLTIYQLKYALRQAIANGLKLAIFNSCDGLGLAGKLTDLQIPQIIVMRELIPDQVAQEFLKNFLAAFAGGKSLYLSVREAREKLQALEDEFPCATWLPVICQNPAEVPKTWQEFRGA